MAAPATPTGFAVQTADAKVYISCNLTATATSYKVQRSADGVTYSTIASPTTPGYLDTSVTSGTAYYYQMAAANNSGADVSAYTTPVSVVPAPVSEMSLQQIRLFSQARADQINSNFLSLAEWNSNINQSLYELYDLLIAAYGEEYFLSDPAQFTTNGSTQTYTLPDGVTSFTNGLTGATGYIASACYKLYGVDLGVNNGPNGWVTVQKFNFIDRNKFFYPNTNSTMYGVFNMSYRLKGNSIIFIPLPSGNMPVRVWCVPRMTQLIADTDCSVIGFSGWLEYVIVDAAIKAMQKEESDCSALMAQKEALRKRIEAMANNRDQGMPDTISDTRGSSFGGSQWGMGDGFKGGW